MTHIVAQQKSRDACLAVSALRAVNPSFIRTARWSHLLTPRRSNYGHTLVRRLGGRADWAIFRNWYLVDYCEKLKMLEDFPP